MMIRYDAQQCQAVLSRQATQQVVERLLPPSLLGRRRLLFYGNSLTDGSSYPDYFYA